MNRESVGVKNFRENILCFKISGGYFSLYRIGRASLDLRLSSFISSYCGLKDYHFECNGKSSFF